MSTKILVLLGLVLCAFIGAITCAYMLCFMFMRARVTVESKEESAKWEAEKYVTHAYVSNAQDSKPQHSNQYSASPLFAAGSNPALFAFSEHQI